MSIKDRCLVINVLRMIENYVAKYALNIIHIKYISYVYN